MSKKPSAKKQEKKNSGNRGLKAFIILYWTLIGGGLSAFFMLMFLISTGIFGSLPTTEHLENPRSYLATEIYSSDGALLGNFFKENRSNAEFEELSPELVQALIATEDIRFYQHSGIDQRSLFRVFVKSFLLGRSESGGGSTITQQLAKNLFHQRPQSKLARVQQKLKEWIIAVRLESRYTKEEILTMYLNTVEFVNNAHGIKSAARVYFNTTPEELRIEEAAVLVGMVKNPSLFNPRRFPERAFNRRNVVLSQMHNYGFISTEDFDSLRTIELNLDYQIVDHNIGPAPYFREHLRRFLTDWVRANPKSDGTTWDIYRDGLRIHTTLDSRMQRYAEEATKEHMAALQKDFYTHWEQIRYDPWTWPNTTRQNPRFLEIQMRRSERYRVLKAEGLSEDSIRTIFNTPVEMRVFTWEGGDANNEKDTIMSPMDSIRYYVYFLQPGMMAADPHTGEVLAWVGGFNHSHFQVDHVRTRRQVGSTFKPFVYSAAITELGYSPCMQMLNSDIVFDQFQNWSPRNSGTYKEGEMVELRDALANSLNKITAKLMYNMGQTTGPHTVIDLVRQMGIKAPMDPYPSISLGTSDISVLEMVGAYTSFVNNGFYSKPYFITRIEDRYGNTIATFGPEQTQVFPEETAYVMLQFLQDVVNRGTGQRLRFRYGLNNQIGGKTGTTQENTDGWFMGVTPDLVAGVWVGGSDPVVSFRTVNLGQGANMALPIFGLFLQKVYEDKSLHIDPEATFQKPAGPMNIELDCSKYRFDNESAPTPYDQGLGF